MDENRQDYRQDNLLRMFIGERDRWQGGAHYGLIVLKERKTRVAGAAEKNHCRLEDLPLSIESYRANSKKDRKPEE